MVILEDEKIVFVHIPKCGGTSASVAFDEVARWNDIFVGGTEVGEFLNKGWAVRFRLRKHSAPDELRQALGIGAYTSYTKFVLVRNPITRFLSAYNFMLRHMKARSEWMMPSVKAYGLHKLKDINDFISSDFLTHIEDSHRKWIVGPYDNYEQAQMMLGVKLFVPQFVFLDPEEMVAGRFRYFKLEDANHFDSFMKLIGFNRGVKLGNHNSNDSKTIDATSLSDRGLKRVVDLYASDFSVFDYPLPPACIEGSE